MFSTFVVTALLLSPLPGATTEPRSALRLQVLLDRAHFSPGEIPADMMDKAKLTALAYTSALEGLGEKFHCSERLLRTLNPGATFTRSGERLQVPNVGEALAGKAASVVLDKSESSVQALDASGQVIASYPATMGSAHDPVELSHLVSAGTPAVLQE